MVTKICTWTAKTRAVPSLHRDNFLAKVPGPCQALRQVTPTNFIAGPLAFICVGSNNLITSIIFK
jgi:hypothetical protein